MWTVLDTMWRPNTALCPDVLSLEHHVQSRLYCDVSSLSFLFQSEYELYMVTCERSDA